VTRSILEISPSTSFLSRLSNRARRVVFVVVRWHHISSLLAYQKFNRYLYSRTTRAPKTIELRHVDYGVQFNRLMYERLVEDRNITLFSPKSVPGLYEAFYADQNEFRRLYTEAEKNNVSRRKSLRRATSLLCSCRSVRTLAASTSCL
jgi:hypothetical protein